MKNFMLVDLDRAVLEWFKQKRVEEVSDLEQWIVKKRCVSIKININEPFFASAGWLTQYKKHLELYKKII